LMIEERINAIKTERATPLNFIRYTTANQSGSNLVLENIINGTVYNNAKYVTYYNFKFEVSYFDNSGQQLGAKYADFNESVFPQQNKNFKLKVRMPLKARTFNVKLISAVAR